MKIVKYFVEFLFILVLLIIFRITGYKIASRIGALIVAHVGPFFRSKKKIISNLKKALPDKDKKNLNSIIKKMWENYGRILSEYIFIKDFRNSNKYLKVEGQNILDNLKKSEEPVVFISGHFNNFELMAMQIEKTGINLGAIYRPLNNVFLNKIMEHIRKKYICKNQIKKGIKGTRELLQLFKKKYSIALMIDQRVSEGILSNLFGEPSFTTTIPAQLVKKYKCKIVPIYIKRVNYFEFQMTVDEPLIFEEKESIQDITDKLNLWLEKKILLNPEQWIWSHNKWKK